MTRFGKPRQTDEKMRCLACGAVFRDHEAELHHAGRTVEGDYWNTKCPNCGSYDRMTKELAELTDYEFTERQHEQARMMWEWESNRL